MKQLLSIKDSLPTGKFNPDGTKAEKPQPFEDEHVRSFHARLEEYNSLPELAYLAIWQVMWDHLYGRLPDSRDGNYLSRQESLSEAIETFDNYSILMDKQLFPNCIKHFVPVGVNGEVLESPYEGMFEIKAGEKRSGWAYLEKDKMHGSPRYYDKEAFLQALEAYQAAQEQVIFDGWTLLSKSGTLTEIGNGKFVIWFMQKETWFILKGKHVVVKSFHDLIQALAKSGHYLTLKK